MGVMISCQGLSKAMTHKMLFQDLTLSLEDGERLGIIGPNGAGKSTLLKMIAGREAVDGGQIAMRKQLRLAFVEQQPELDLQLNLEESMMRAATAVGRSWDSAHVEAQRLLSRLGFEDNQVRVSALSGGWKKRLAIAMALINEPDLVLFDEPTNHLDIRSVLWLEDFLRQAPFAWALVSHDRFFLDRVARRILEINPVYPGSHRIDTGNYSQFMEKKRSYIEHALREQASLANKLRREDEWLVRQPQARGTKAKGRIDEAMRMKAEMEGMKQRMVQSSSDIDFQGSGRRSKQLLVLRELGQRFGERQLFKNLNLVISPGQIMGILGDNGTGKSTLLKIMAGEIQPSEGSVQTIPQLELVYFDQGRQSLESSSTLKKALSEGQDNVIFQGRPVHVASWARRFQFKSEQLDQPLSMLSGGEQAKVLIARLMLRKADVLLLDEPNNDLDIDTLETLEGSLEDFPGAIVLVSHDRYLLDRLCTSFLGLLPGGGIEAYASYEQWEATLREGGEESGRRKGSKDKDKDKSEGGAAASAKPRATKAVKLSYMEQREYDMMEENILKAETALAEAQEALEEAAGHDDPKQLLQASTHLQTLQDQVEKLYARWGELENKAKGGVD